MSAIAGGVLAGMISNVAADQKANEQFEREQQLMRMQNRMNQHNALMAYSNQVQGAKLAGLSPAMLNGATPQVAAPVSKGTSQMAENVEFDQNLGLLDAQKRNVEAQTEKTGAETSKIEGVDTENVKADTDLKAAQMILTGRQAKTEGYRPNQVYAQSEKDYASAEQIKAEAQRINNVNKVFAEENTSVALFGQGLAQGWQKESWYSNLSKGTKMVIDDIANGEFDLSIGILNALNRSISTDSQMSAVEKDKVQNAFTRAVIEGQMKDPKVMQALVKTPKAQYNELVARATKLGVETKMLNFEYDWNVEKKDVWTKNDPDKLYAEYQKDPTIENAAKWLVSSIRNTGADAFRGAGSAAIAGSAAGQGARAVKRESTIKPPSDVEIKNYGNTFSVAPAAGGTTHIYPAEGFSSNQWHWK